jgi:hypothetical protein
VRFDDEARSVWWEVYGELSEGRPGLAGALLGRSAAIRLGLLLQHGLARREEQKTGGRPAERWFAVRRDRRDEGFLVNLVYLVRAWAGNERLGASLKGIRAGESAAERRRPARPAAEAGR